MPIACVIRCQHQPKSPQKAVSVNKLVWSEDKRESFIHDLNSPENCAEIQRAMNLIDTYLNEAASVFTNALSFVSVSLVKKQSTNIALNQWFDRECREKRKTIRKALRIFTRTRFVSDRNSYCAARKEYKKLIFKKRRDTTKCRKELVDDVNDSKKFWNKIKRFTRKKTQADDISDNAWLEHFMKVFDDVNVGEKNAHASDVEAKTINAVDMDAETEATDDVLEEDILNSAITYQEVIDSINHLKAKKVAGPDGLIPDVFKYSCEAITYFCVHLFNRIFISGQYPEAWTEAIIHPLHKKGDRNNPDNYKGISLLNICIKLYSYIINKRLSKWVEEKDILGDIQAGFHKDHSTVDHIFTLFSMIKRYLLKNKKLYVAFIDFRKAFDLILYCKL